MARKQVGRVPADADDAVDKQWAQSAIDVKYTKPPLGIPTTDIAPQAVSLDRIATTGAPTAKTVLYGNGRWGTIVGNFLAVEPEEDLTLTLPPGSPEDGELLMVEIRPVGSQIITVTIPPEIKLTTGLEREYEALPEASFFLGLRWSDRAAAWHLLTAAHEV